MKKIIKYVPVLFLVTASCVFFKNRVEDVCLIKNIEEKIFIEDYIVNFYKGEIPYALSNKEIPFAIPAIWSFYLMYFFAVISWEIKNLFSSSEHQRLIRYGSKKRWCRRGLRSLFREVLLYMLITYVGFVIYAILTGANFGGPNLELQRLLSDIDLTYITRWELLVLLVILPFSVLLAVAYLQYMLSICVSNVMAILILVILLVASVFYLHPMLFGNYLMLIRNEVFMEAGTRLVIGIAFSGIVMIGSYIISRSVIERKDFF